MSEIIQAIYKNGILRPLQTLDFPKNSLLEIDVREAGENGAETMRVEADRVLRETGLTSPLKFSVTEKILFQKKKGRDWGNVFPAKNL